MDYRNKLKSKERIVIKIGTSSLTYPNGKLNYPRLERLAMVISDMMNSGKEVVMVSSGAVGVGAGRLKMQEPPEALIPRQALAAIGQAELIRIYQKSFDDYNQLVAQVLLTRDGLEDDERKNNARNTLNELVRMKIIPIINENDTVSTAEIQFGDNDNLSARVAVLLETGLLIILSDIDGLYSEDPKNNHSAEIISVVTEFTDDIEQLAAGSSSAFSRGGMSTKLQAAKYCMSHGVDVVIINGDDPANILRVISGQEIGTLFVARDLLKVN
jgi:glutamate 5-kinase